MRTNVVLDEELLAAAKNAAGIKTTRGVIDAALRLLVRLRSQEEVRGLRGQIQWEGDLAALRESRFPDYTTPPESEADDVGG